MPLDFNKHAQKGNEFLNRLTVLLGDKTKKNNAGKILKAVFKTLREYLSLEENFHLLAQLPMALKAVYIEGWMPTHKLEKGRKKIEFIQQYLNYRDRSYIAKVQDVEMATKEINLVFFALKKYISAGEFEDILSVLPTQIKKLISNNIYSKEFTLKQFGNRSADKARAIEYPQY